MFHYFTSINDINIIFQNIENIIYYIYYYNSIFIKKKYFFIKKDIIELSGNRKTFENYPPHCYHLYTCYSADRHRASVIGTSVQGVIP